MKQYHKISSLSDNSIITSFFRMQYHNQRSLQFFVVVCARVPREYVLANFTSSVHYIVSVFFGIWYWWSRFKQVDKAPTLRQPVSPSVLLQRKKPDTMILISCPYRHDTLDSFFAARTRSHRKTALSRDQQLVVQLPSYSIAAPRKKERKNPTA